MHPGRPHGRKESGNVIVLTAMMATAFFGVMGLAVEVSGFYSAKRKMQTAADAGAKSGAIEIWRVSGNWEVEARRGATQNGYTDGVDGATVIVNSPPTDRASAVYQNSNFVEVIVQQTQNLHLMTILSNRRTTTLTAWAVGGLVSRPGASIVVLDPSDNAAFKVGGGGTINIEGAIQINSNNANAMVVNGTVTASSIGVTGTGPGYTGCCYSPTPTTGTAPLPDPLAYLSPPSYSATCDPDPLKTNLVLDGGSAGSPLQVYPGNYCGGILIKSGSYVNFHPGQYILLGKNGLSGTGGPTITGTGVSFYNTWCRTTDACYTVKEARTAGPFLLGGGGSMTLSAPESGPMAGVLFFQDRAAPLLVSSTAGNFSGGSTMCFTGAIYLKTQKLTWGGGGGACGGWQMIIADEIEFSGGSTAVQSNYGAGGVPTPLKGAALVE
jgi:Flp pilus assembly protein TadG